MLRRNDSTTEDHVVLDLAGESRLQLEAANMQRQILLNAYRRLSNRVERLDPNGWSAEVSMEVLEKWTRRGMPASSPLLLPPTPPIREVIAQTAKRRDRVRIGIASMPGRELGLERVLEILVPQADEIFVYLNGMTQVPPRLSDWDNVRYFVGPDYGDRAKFLFLKDFEGYYLTCDDDIDYASYHVQSLVDGIERYGRGAIVGWHGSIFQQGFAEFYNAAHRRVLSFRFARGEDTGVHLLGTGASGFHTSTIRLRFEDFDYPNMADVFLAIEAQQQEIPMVVLKHEGGVAVPLETGSPSISEVSLGKVDGHQKLDVADTASKLVRDQGEWRIHKTTQVYERPSLRVAIIGRTDKKRWKKGGILKSCHLTAEALQRFHAKVQLEDIETGSPQTLHGFDAEIVMIYVGDPERPDFAKVEALVDHHAGLGRVVVINLSLNNVPTRHESIVAKMRDWDVKHPGLIRMMVFTRSAVDLPELREIRHMLIVIPKTMVYPGRRSATFSTSKGIFLGDIAKLSDSGLLGGPISAWTTVIRDTLPGVPIFAVQQYMPRYKVEVDVDEVWPFMTDDFESRLSQMRLMVSPVKFATFEMVPLEVASVGVPVVHRSMPQSLSEYLGLSGIEVDTPEELRKVLPSLYNDPLVWNGQSRAGSLRAQSSELGYTSGQLYLALIGAREDALQYGKALK